MTIISSTWHFATIILSFLWARFIDWLYIFIAPLKNLEMLWIIIPIWINWFFTEFFQEKKGTSLGNAVTNGGVMAWVGVDWIRYTIRLIGEKKLKLTTMMTFTKFGISAIIIAIGVFIIIEGVKDKEYVHFLGRIRETTYLLVMFSPIIYDVITPNWNYLLSIIIYAPLFYYLIELIDRYTPDPETYEDQKRNNNDDNGLLGGGLMSNELNNLNNLNNPNSFNNPQNNLPKNNNYEDYQGENQIRF